MERCLGPSRELGAGAKDARLRDKLASGRGRAIAIDQRGLELLRALVTNSNQRNVMFLEAKLVRLLCVFLRRLLYGKAQSNAFSTRAF
jgi:hypothetical protein